LDIIKIQYELNDMEIDRSRNIEMISFMKDYATFSNEIAYSLHNGRFLDSSNTAKSLMTDEYFNFCVAQHVGLLRKLQTCSN